LNKILSKFIDLAALAATFPPPAIITTKKTRRPFLKLLRYGALGNELPGILDEGGRLRDLSQNVGDIDAATLSPERLKALNGLDPTALPLVEGSQRIGAPVAGVGKIIAVGRNYAAHAAETKSDVPTEPLLFCKAVTSLSGPNDPVVIPKGASTTDWEVELALVIGTKAQYVAEEDSLDHVAGYSVMLDVSEREYQLNRGGQYLKGKSFDSFGPLGPWLVTADEVPDPQNLNLWTDVNGTRRQDDNTENMIFGAAHLVSYISHFMTLMPGDVITTGTPSGVGLGCEPQEFLKAGDEVRLSVEGLGEQRHPVVSWQDPA